MICSLLQTTLWSERLLSLPLSLSYLSCRSLCKSLRYLLNKELFRTLACHSLHTGLLLSLVLSVSFTRSGPRAKPCKELGAAVGEKQTAFPYSGQFICQRGCRQTILQFFVTGHAGLGIWFLGAGAQHASLRSCGPRVSQVVN